MQTLPFISCISFKGNWFVPYSTPAPAYTKFEHPSETIHISYYIFVYFLIYVWFLIFILSWQYILDTSSFFQLFNTRLSSRPKLVIAISILFPRWFFEMPLKNFISESVFSIMRKWKNLILKWRKCYVLLISPCVFPRVEYFVGYLFFFIYPQ